jgi:uncharacterized membrane protein
MNNAVPVDSRSSAAIRHVEFERPWRWLAAGWRDLMAAPATSLAYGVVFALAGYLITVGLFAADIFYLVLPMTAGFMIIGPFAATGFYEISRQRQAGRRAPLREVFGAWRRNPSQIALMGVALLLILIFWARIAALIFMLYYGVGNVPSVDKLLVETFLQPSSIPFLIFGTAVGGVLAAATFAISAVSIPMLVDRPRCNVIDAIVTSVKAVLANPRAMALWGLLIVVFVGAGLVTLYVGLVVALPLIGHATWHAYKDLVQIDVAEDETPATS